MAAKAKLTLSQFLFRRSSNNQTGNDAGTKNEGLSTKTCVKGSANDGKVSVSHFDISKSVTSQGRKMSSGKGVPGPGGRGCLDENPPSDLGKPALQPKMAKADSQQKQQNYYQTPQQRADQQLHGILKKPSNASDLSSGSGGFGQRTHRSSLQRSKSNPNPSNNPLKEVSWSCPTLEKRREVILNYFERIILENKQEQGCMTRCTSKPNIPCDANNGEPIYEEISDYSGILSNKEGNTGSLKPKLGPKKVRMNVPVDYNRNHPGQSPIYDKVLCRSHSMLESSTSSSHSVYDVAPSVTTSISSSSTHSLYENFRPSNYYEQSMSSSDSDYSSVGGGYSGIGQGNGKNTTSRMAGRSHSFHDNYRNNGNYNAHAPTVDTDQLYAKVCKRKKMKAATEPAQSRPSSYPDTQSDYFESEDNQQLHVQVSCGNVVTMIPVMMPSPAKSAFSTSCLSLSSSSDNNTDDMITTSITSINSRNNVTNHNTDNGLFHYEPEKILPEKNIKYINNCEGSEGPSQDSCPPTSAAARNRNNLSVIHLLAAYNPLKQAEEFIPTPSYSTSIIDSTQSAPKSISVPVRVDFSASTTSKVENEVPSYPPSQPLMVKNFGYDNNAFQADDDDAYADEEDNNNHHKNLHHSGSPSAKDNSGTATSNSSTSGADDGNDGSCSSGTSDTDTDEDEHHAQKYSFRNENSGRGVLKTQPNKNRGTKCISFQDELTSSTVTKELLLLTTSESEDDEERCEHKSLIDMNNGAILDDVAGKGDKYEMMDDEDRGFDSFMDDSGLGDGKGDESPSFRSENYKDQRTFAQMSQGVPPAQLKKKAASVLDLINSEISDLHMRELELKKIHGGQESGPFGKEKDGEEGSAEEFEGSSEDDYSDSAIEFDGFTTNGSHSSGQVSPSENMNEIITHNQEEVQEEDQGDEEDEEEEEDEVDMKGKKEVVPLPRGEIKVRPLEDEEDKSIKFLATNETPIEREIRLTREREEEFRRNNHAYLAVCPVPAQKSAPTSLPIIKPRDVSSRPENKTASDLPSLPHIPSSVAAKDIQLEMATARFKREIEEDMLREKELMREARQKKSQEDDDPVTEPIPEESEPEPVVEEVKPEVPAKPTQPTPPQPPVENAVQLRKPTIAKLSIAKLPAPAARFFSPPAFNANKPSRITPVVSPIISRTSPGFPSNNNSVVGGSLPVGISRASFTPFEKYLMQSSMNYMAKQNGETATLIAEEPIKTVKESGIVNKHHQSPILEDPLRIIQKPADNEETIEENKDADEKPKRRYVPAQDKINREIQELAMREKELNRARGKWKSTLDLPEAMKDAEEEKEPLRRTTSTTQSSLSLNASQEPAEPTTVEEREPESDFNLTVTSEDVRQVTRVKAPPRRRHSMLINQWEERIRQQQQLNNKK